MKTINIGKKTISNETNTPPFLIAEAGVNHEGDINKALDLIEKAANAGADAIKFQSYKAEKLASRFSPSYWNLSQEATTSQFELFKKFDAFWKKEYEVLHKHCEKAGIIFLSTPFDNESVDFLDELMPVFKIASADISNLPFLRYIARKNKPLLLSTGATTVSEIWRAIETINELENKEIVLLHCILNYPTPYENANLAMIADMKRKFPDFLIGYSDHTLPINMNEVLTAAWLLGACVLEKHFTYDKTLPGNDHYHAMDENDIKQFIDHINFMLKIMGKTNKHYIDDELIARKNARRSLVAAKSIPANTMIAPEHIAIKRPGTGVSPEMLNIVIGSTAMRDIAEDEIINYGDFVCTNNSKKKNK